MEIKIDTNKNMLYVTKEIADEIKKTMGKRNTITALQALERTQFLEDIEIVTIASKKREISEEEHKINIMKVEDIEADMKTRPAEDQKEYEAFIKEEKAKIKGQKTKNGKDKKVNAMKIKTWYKKKYYKKETK